MAQAIVHCVRFRETEPNKNIADAFVNKQQIIP